MGRSYAGILGPVAFVTMLARGLLAGSGADGVIWAALGCLFLFAGIGYLCGQLAENVVLDSVKQRFHEELEQQRATVGRP